MHTESIFVDSSAFYALMDRSDMYHQSAKLLWPNLLEDHINLQTSNYIVMESLRLLQYRLGHEAASMWYKDILGVMDIFWVDQCMHHQAYQLWMSLGRNRYSLVDCVSYLIMHQHHIETVFSFKRGYTDQGFKLLAPMTTPGKISPEKTPTPYN